MSFNEIFNSLPLFIQIIIGILFLSLICFGWALIFYLVYVIFIEIPYKYIIKPVYKFNKSYFLNKTYIKIEDKIPNITVKKDAYLVLIF